MKNVYACSRRNSTIVMTSVFTAKCEQSLKQAARRECEIFVLQGFQNLVGPVCPAFMNIPLYREGAWNKWAAVFPFKLNSYIIQTLYKFILYLLWIKNWEEIQLFFKYLPMQKILYMKCIFNLTCKDKRKTHDRELKLKMSDLLNCKGDQ